MRALIIHTQGGLGDLLLSSPLAEAIHRGHPGSEVLVWGNPKFTPVLQHHPFVQGFVDLPAAMKTFAGADALRRYGFDCVLLPWSTSKHAWMTRLAGIPVRVGQGGRLTYSFLFTHQVKVRSVGGDTHSHWVDIQLDYARALNLPVEGLAPQVFLTDSERSEGRALLENLGVPADQPVCALQICKGLAVDAERWPLDLFVAVGRQMAADGYAIVLTGTENERALTEIVRERIGHPAVFNTAGLFTLRQTASLLSRCAVTICPDTGTGHLSAALGVPAVSIFALKCDVAARWRPFGAAHRIVQATEVRCTRNCVKETCPRFECLLDVDPAAVAAAAREIAVKG